MRKGIVAGVIAAVLWACAAQAQMGISVAPGPGFTPQQTFNVTDYGAVCDGVATAAVDNAGINRALAAAAASTAYQNNQSVRIVGPTDGVHPGCNITSLNATVFTLGSGALPTATVEIANLNLNCSGAGNVCLDMIGSKLIDFHNVSITGSSSSIPEICVQVGTATGVSAAWHSVNKVNCRGLFALTAFYNVGSEANTYSNVVWENNNNVNGPIGTLGSITAGTSYTTGTYTAVPLTGGSGSGALATVVVAGGGVSSVTITYEGRDYKPSDTLSAAAASIGGTGSGFSVPVSAIHNFAAIIDGQDHWRAASAYASVTLTPDSAISQTLVTMVNANIRQSGTGGALWLAHTGGLKIINSYAYNGSGACAELYDSGVGQQYGLSMNLNCEGGVSEVLLLEGANATPTLSNFDYRGYHFATTQTIATASNITGATMNGAHLELYYNTTAVPMFSNAGLWTVSGDVRVPSASYWTTPAAFQGTLCEGTASCFTGDLFGNNVAAKATTLAQPAGAAITFAGALGSSPTLSGTNGLGYLSTGSGFILQGYGTTCDFTFRSPTGSNVMCLLHGSQITAAALGSFQVGSTTEATMSAGEVGFAKAAASGTAPGAGFVKLGVVCGTNAGTAKVIAYGGTSTTAATVLDNIGAGVTGC